MKKLLIFGNFLLITLVLNAQADYFLFIQSENNQTFYVQNEGRILSSSVAGHLIIPNLKDSVYRLNIGFPKNQYQEQVFELRINKRDAGYQLKNMGSEGWALLNLQTLQLIQARQAESKKQAISYGEIKKTDVFSTLMAGLVNDSAVLYTSIAKADPPKENAQLPIPDIPASTNVVRRGENSTSDTQALKVDTTLVKTDIAKVEDPVLKDTSRLQINAKSDVAPDRDSMLAKSEPLKELVRDSSVAQISLPKQASEPNRDSVKTVLAPLTDNRRNDTPAVNTVATAEPVVSEKKMPIDETVIPKQASDSQALDTKSTQLKPLIIWFSETKTDRGMELVYYDMTAPDKTDTIRILIPKEEIVYRDSIKENKPGIIDENKRDDNSNRDNNFFGRLFGKNRKNEVAVDNNVDKKNAKARESSIKVTTVESNKVVDSPVVVMKKEPASGSDVATKEKTNAEKKSSSGKLIEKIFGKKGDKSTGVDSVNSNGSGVVKVTTVQDGASGPSKTGNKKANDITNRDVAEVEKLRKAQDNEDETSTQRFFSKLFGKKATKISDSSDNKSSQNKSQAAIKVTNVPRNAEEKKIGNNVIVTNSDCRTFASDHDLDKLRVRMLGEKDADGQVTEARKFFKVKCLSTRQVQSLSNLFRNDEGKYKLLDAAYPYVSDSNNFKELIGLLSDEYYINRFKAMVRM